MAKDLELAIVGAAGPIGAEVVRALELEDLPLAGVRFLDRAEAIGETVPWGGEERPVEEATAASFAGVDVAFFLPGSPWELLAPARAARVVVLDASGRSAADPTVPLIFPGLNDEELEALPEARTIALPSPAAAQLATVLLPLAAKGGVVRASVTSLEGVAGAGLAGVERLSHETASLLNGREPEGESRFRHRVAFNLVPEIGAIDAEGIAAGERALVDEARRLLAGELPPLAATRVVVPVFYGATQVVDLALEKPLGAADARALLGDAPGVKVLDDGAAGVYPMPILVFGDEALHVGRIRATAGGLSLVTVVDDLYWGVALPLVRLAGLLRDRELL